MSTTHALIRIQDQLNALAAKIEALEARIAELMAQQPAQEQAQPQAQAQEQAQAQQKETANEEN